MENKTKSKISKIINWSLVGVIIAVIFGIFTVYAELREKNPTIIYEVVSESNVLDIHKPIKDLSISFRGDDIQQLRQNLRIFTINVKNTGNKNVVQNDYDYQIPWGLSFKNAKLIEQPKIIDSNSEYITKNLKPRILMNNIVEFSKIIFEHGKYFIIEIQVLHPIDKNPELESIGKVAGVEKQQIIKYKASDSMSFLAQLFSGSILVQITRALIFFIVGLFLMIGILLLLVTIDERKTKRATARREKLKEEYLAPLMPSNDSHGRKIINSIIDKLGLDIEEVNELYSIMTQPDIDDRIERILKIIDEYDGLASIDKYILPRLLNDSGIRYDQEKSERNKNHQYLIQKLDEILQYINENPIPGDLKKKGRKSRSI